VTATSSGPHTGEVLLPAEQSRLVGRRDVLEELLARAAAPGSVITLVGPGGMGKTRLAMRALYSLAERGEAAWFCELAHATDPSAIAARLLAVAQLPVTPGVDETILAGRRLEREGDVVVVLDNCEQATAHVARAIGVWRSLAPRARFVATSRERLRVQGERAIELSPLSGGPHGEAVELFVERARAVRLGYEPRDDERAIIAEIGRRLDGLPLAIEIAASRMRVLSPAEILARLDRRFDLLRSRDRDRPERHATLEAAIETSFELLDEDERRVLGLLSVFRGSFSLEAVERVAESDVIDVVEALRDKSLVYEVSPGRLAMYESIREYSAHRLPPPERDRAIERLVQWLFELAGDPPSPKPLERESMRVVFEHLAAVDPLDAAGAERALRAAIVYHEACEPNPLPLRARDGLDRAIEHADECSSRWLAEALFVRTTLQHGIGKNEEAERDATRAIEIAERSGDPMLARRARMLRGATRFQLDRLDDARADIEASLAAHRGAGDEARVASTLRLLGAVLQSLGDLLGARVAFEESLDLCRRIGDRYRQAIVHASLGTHALECELFETARSHLEEALSLAREIDYARAAALASGYLGLLELETNELDAARRHLDQAIDLARTSDQSLFDGAFRAIRSAVSGRQDRLDEAERDLVAARELLAKSPVQLAVAETHGGHLALALVRRAIAAGDAIEAQRLRANARACLEASASIAQRSDDARIARRVLARALDREPFEGLERASRTERALLVARGGEWFCVDFGPRIELVRKPVLRALLLALVRARIERGTSMSTDDLVAAAWPNERVSRELLRNRLHVALVALRKLGLRDLLAHAEGHYALAESASIGWG
jgi:tetratricopeptide (TPR) repeat protein